MGLKLRLNLFYQQQHSDVYEALTQYYTSLGRALQSEGREFSRLDLHQYDHPWTVLNLDGGWDEWNLRREACKHVSRVLNCAAFSLFVYDGDFWGYEMVHAGNAVDYFIQAPDHSADWFPNQNTMGSASTVTHYLPSVSEDQAQPYLVQHLAYPEDAPAHPAPIWEEWTAQRDALDVAARAGDEFTRFSECAVLDFLRMLGIRVELRTRPGEVTRYVTFVAPVWRSFWISGS
jgi:hypothetical protein